MSMVEDFLRARNSGGVAGCEHLSEGLDMHEDDWLANGIMA